MGDDRRLWESKQLGVPVDRVDWCHGSAGRIDEGCRVDCWVRVDKESVREARFEVFGGPEAMQAAAWLADWLADRSVASALTVTGRWLAEAAALPDEARTVALDIEDALRSALAASTEVIDGANDEH
ncbi:hypothetical protein FPL09_08405 [Spiribacter vilamensis]|nr:hypothetical protein FPL09_08405 [Spiribacter vilamensis]